MKRSFLYLFILILLGFANTAFAQGEIYGVITDETNNPFPGVVVKVTQGGLMKGGTITEDDGSYSVKPLSQGTYDIQFSSTGYSPKVFASVSVTSGGAVKINYKMTVDAQNLKEFIITEYKAPVVTKHPVKTAADIESLPTRTLLDVASLSTNVQQSRNGGALRIGGAREDGTVFVIDGQVVQQGNGPINPPQGTVDQLQVFASGIPANLGDATGGVVSITTKGLTNKLKGAVQGQHSVDGYNNNLLNASLTGPLISRTRDEVKEPILGFLMGIDYQYDEDANPSFIKNPVLKSDVLKSLQENPLTLVNTANGTVMLPSSNRVSKNDFDLQKQQINNSSTVVRFNGKLDYAVNNNINVTAGGSFNYNNSDVYNRSRSYFAPEATPTNIGSTYRGFLRLRQSFNNRNSKGTGDSAKRAVISNAFYTIQADYQYTTSRTEDPNFKRNLFDYGYVGKFTQNRLPLYQFGEDTASGRKAIILQTLDAVSGIGYEASDKNPILSNYTKNVYQNTNSLGFLSDLTQVQRYGGMMNGDFPNQALQVQNVGIANIGTGLTGYNYGTFSQIGLHADASFDFKPGKKTTHAIQFGLYYEQRSNSNYGASVNIGGTGNNSLWNRMVQLSNSHILALDYANPRFIHNGKEYSKEDVDKGAFFGPTDTIIYNRLDNGTQTTFDKNLREKLGAGRFDYLDVHSVDPSMLSLDMFSADELINGGQSFVSYNGYDYTGKKLNGQINFNDFFTAKDASGRLTRPIGAFSPNYIAGYVMDNFRFQEMNFNIGVRIERYDNNTKVLKDPYSLYELNKKGSVEGTFNPNGAHPDNIGDDYAVYVNNNNSLTPRVIGYRNGDKWYNVDGVEIPDPNVLKTENGGTDPQPYLTPEGKIKMENANFDPNRTFTDYKPQVTASPRFQFDFPINDGQALFYAHYDILVQRPKTGNFATPLDYMFLERNSGAIIGNPDLKPEKTFDYELGFQQQVSKNSGLGISAFYRERKDMIQVRPYLFAWPQTYYTYGNRDFSTTKGFTFSYDYRKPANANIPIAMTIAYTLQFADGTGSNAASGNGGNGNQVSSSGLIQNFITAGLPNLRYVAPLTYDSRHNINLNLVYSYGENEGPTVNGKHFLQNFNANMIMRARSGEPYTTYQNVVGNAIQGGLNGTRLPWHFGIDLRFSKNFQVSGFAKKATDATDAPIVAKRKYYVSTFIYFQNIFNIRDVLGVYPYTSRPDDDGYVTSPNGQQFFNSSLSPTTLQDLYTLYVNNPGFYNGPRRANVGFSFSF